MNLQQQLGQPGDNNNNMIDIIGLEGVTQAVTNTLIHGEIDALCEAAMPSVANENEELNQDEFPMEDVPHMNLQQQLVQPVDNNNNMIDIIGLEGVTPAVTNTLIHGEIDALL